MQPALPLLLASFALIVGCGSVDTGGGITQGTGGSGGSASGTGGTGAAAGSGGAGGAGATTSTSTGGTPSCGDVAPPNEILADATDPEAGDFTLDEALAELPAGPGPLRAIIDTDLGVLTCTMHPNEAPIGVANFIGLARGRRAWKDKLGGNKWVRRPFYDGLTFHRVIPQFVAQGGDPLGDGTGGPGYKFVNEIAGLTHLAGTLAYANAGANTNGSQFYICETPQPSLDSGYTIFGECEPVEVVTALTDVPTEADKPITDVHIKTVTVTRCAP